MESSTTAKIAASETATAPAPTTLHNSKLINNNDNNMSPSKMTSLKHSLVDNNSESNGAATESGQVGGVDTVNPKRMRLSESSENINTTNVPSPQKPISVAPTVVATEKQQPQITKTAPISTTTSTKEVTTGSTIGNKQPKQQNEQSSSSSSDNNNGMQSTENTHNNNGSDSKGGDKEIDEGLYSRQLYVLGHEAMRRMQAANVLISGLGGLGLEIAKNVALGGVKSLTLQDTANLSHDDLASHFFAQESQVGENRALISYPHLAELNPYVPIKVLDTTKPLACDQELAQYQVIVLTTSNHEEQLAYGKYCHANNIKLIIAQTRGIFGQIFCDLGEKFECVDTDGENPQSAMISAINSDEQGTVTTLDEQRHGFEDGMTVTFREVIGYDEAETVNGKEFVIKVFGPYTFGIGDTSTLKGKYSRGGFVTQVKKPKVLTFKALNQAMLEPEEVISDFCKMEDSKSILVAFATVSEYQNRNEQRLPLPWSSKDATAFIALAKEVNTSQFKFPETDLSDYVLRLFSYTLQGQLSPMQAVIGGAAAQEVMKALSGKFMPIKQYFHFDCRECLPEKPLIEAGGLDLANYRVGAEETQLLRYKAQIAVFGKEFQVKLAQSKYFMVGAGALGCEYIKNFAMMGACIKTAGGKLILTDMDIIEKSNLNRQFLFRTHDVQKSKSVVASSAAKKMNPNIQVEAHENRVGPDTEQIYNDEFFEQLDGVCNALDNIDARVYMDRRCVYYHKPLIESGTLGTKGNVQVVLPNLTESYSSTQDPPEKSIPICTLKNFPNAIEHTLQWARDMFEGLFTNPATAATDFLKDPQGYVQRVLKLQGSQPMDDLQQVHRALVEEKPKSFEDCVKWARLNWQENYHNSISQLLFNFPKDQTTSSGLPFWSGPKRCPHALTFSEDNETYVDYVFSAANLKAEMYGLEQNRDRKSVCALIRAVSVPEFKPKQGVKIHVNDSEAQNAQSSGNYEQDHLDAIIKTLTEDNTEVLKTKIVPVEFEKDCDANMHMDFIVSCSNLRAENYDIAPADRHKSKLIAGRIIPAIATTTSLIVGLDTIELYKLIQGHKNLEMYKSSFVNLALPFFGLSEPMPPKKSKYYENEFSLWDRFEVNGEMTLQEFLDYFKEKHQLEITMLSQGVTMLYAFFMPKAKLSERLNMPISKIVEQISKKEISGHVKALVLEICCNDKDGNDLEVPYVKYNLTSA